MRQILWVIFPLYLLTACSGKKEAGAQDLVIGRGQMPAITKGPDNTLHVVYGTGDSIMYSFSSDQGKSFSLASLIAVLPDLAASHTRGPQIASTKNGLVVLACNGDGDIFSYTNSGESSWVPAAKVNDVDTVAKENLMSLSSDGQYAYAVWLDLRGNKHNKIYGARSDDGGKTWIKNTMVYTSPDSTVCECCRPSVAVQGNDVYVMFRNWLKGNRDMYLIKSSDGGNTFGQAQKLGNGSWALDGCPMDGGSLAIGANGAVQTVWRREDKLYAAIPGFAEKGIGDGKGSSMDIQDGKNVYSWIENGEIVISTAAGKRQSPGKGKQPVLKAISNDQLVCVWENDQQIHATIINN